jgi:hypothetical protein
MLEFAQVVETYDPKGGQCVLWPISDLSEALHSIRANAASTPPDNWDEKTLLHSPFVPSSRVYRTPAQPGFFEEDGVGFPSLCTTGFEFFVQVKGPGFHVEIDTLCKNAKTADDLVQSRNPTMGKVLVLAEDPAVQAILESERIVARDGSPWAFPHLKIGSRVVVHGLKKESFLRFNGQDGIVLGDGHENERIIVDLPEKSLLIKRQNLVLMFGQQEQRTQPDFGKGQNENASANTKSPVNEGGFQKGFLNEATKNNLSKAAADKDAARSEAQQPASTQSRQAASGEAQREPRCKGSKEKKRAAHKDLNEEKSAGHKDLKEDKNDCKRKGDEGKSKIVELEPVFQQTCAKEDRKTEVGVCYCSGNRIFAGDDYVILSCSARCSNVLLQRTGMLEICPAAECQTSKGQTRNPKPETRNPKP